MKTQSLQLSEIITDAGTQTRACTTDDVVADYAERWLEGDKFPPIVVFHDGVAYYLADGFHRYLAAKRNEFKDILAEVHQGTVKDALRYALGANRANGLRRTNADKRRCVWLALENFTNQSDRAIAEMCGVHHTFVANVRRDHEETKSELATVASSRIGMDGKTRKLPDRGLQPASMSDSPHASHYSDSSDPSEIDISEQVVPALAGSVDYFQDRLNFLEQAIQQVRRDFPARDSDISAWLLSLAKSIQAA